MFINFLKTVLFTSIPLIISYTIYKKITCMDILANINHSYMKTLDLLKGCYINDTIIVKDDFKIANTTFYRIYVKEYEFIIFHKNETIIDLETYTKFRKALIMTTPDDIIMASMSLKDQELDDIDIIEPIKKLCGPYLNQLNDKNKLPILLYIQDKYKSIMLSDIKSIDIMYSNGTEKTLEY